MNEIELSLKRLSDIGKHICQVRFNFDDLYESCSLYWKLDISDQVEFSQSNIQFIEQGTLQKLVSERRMRWFGNIYPLLPEEIKSRVSVLDLIRVFQQGIGNFLNQIEEHKGVITGHYNELEDICYISNKLPNHKRWCPGEYKTIVVVHELAHRYLHHKRAKLGLGPQVVYAFLEEKFCTDLEASFCSYVFVPDTRTNTLRDVEIGREILSDSLKSLLNPDKIHLHTQGEINHYGKLLKDYIQNS